MELRWELTATPSPKRARQEGVMTGIWISATVLFGAVTLIVLIAMRS
jgi:hypothetical protein